MNKKAIALMAALCFCVFANAKEVVRIPFESRNGTIILTVKLNDFPRPLKLLFDTGADGMAVGQGLATLFIWGISISKTRASRYLITVVQFWRKSISLLTKLLFDPLNHLFKRSIYKKN